MQAEPGDDYIRRMAAYVRANERNLAAHSLGPRQRRQQQQRQQQQQQQRQLNPLGWFFSDSSNAPPKPMALSLDTHHLFYLLIRMEAAGLNVGSLDVRIESPSRPMHYINLFSQDKSDTLSLASIRSTLSAVSNLSLGSAWWGRPQLPSLDLELKYLYSSFSKIPALSLSVPGRKVIAELENEPPNQNAIPLDAFKTLTSLECSGIDPRTLLGWDRLAISLRSLVLKNTGLEDISDLFVGAVNTDQTRRGTPMRGQALTNGPKKRASFHSSILPDSVPEDADEGEQQYSSDTDLPRPASIPNSFSWAFLRSLSLSDNSLAFIPHELFPILSSLSHLDLSSNLLVSVPPGLELLHDLTSLDLSDNMIDSVLGIYRHLGQVLAINLAHNRLESLCGLERLRALERIDVRDNILEDSTEISRLATLPNVTEVWVEGNPFCEFEEDYRIRCFEFFWKESSNILLDGTPPGVYEKRQMSSCIPDSQAGTPPMAPASSPPVVAVGHRPQTPPLSQDHEPLGQILPSEVVSPPAVHGVPRRKKKPRRIVDLEAETKHSDSSSSGPRRETQYSSNNTQARVGRRHSRYNTDYTPSHRPSQADDRPRRQTTASSDSPPFPTRQTLHTASKRAARQSASLHDSVPFATKGIVTDDIEIMGEAAAFRKRMEELKRDMGDGWLNVFSQGQSRALAPP